MDTLLWIGDAVIILAVIPIALTLLARIIFGLARALRALNHIGQSAHGITQALPSALAEVAGVADAVDRMRPGRQHAPASR